MIDVNSDKNLSQIDKKPDFIKNKFPKLDTWDAKNSKLIYHKFSGSKVRKWAKLISFAGDPRLWGPTFVILSIWGIINEWSFSLLTIFLSGFFQSFAIYFIIKNFIKRPRPFVQYDDIIRLDKTGHGFSFPSGHCHHSTILVGLIGIVFFPFPWFIPILVAYNVAIGYSRMILGCHFPSDTIFGTIEAYLELGFFWFLTKDLYINLYEWLMNVFF
ncbi:hypothetical protein NEF87_004715 [Candidatus Lokiarchaeum ossiferum]|uniref:Phosphatidic acid phosphatase type 2/haloperoxidase domain-containing protein n=1 Tax=Candidatus Lokiarchaeum ossiferum TaxID=2951803 RepID=A0ABY6HY21_9ARCH|nr:hypothetical protein NEF87_004715 [Candidatus Lokiarchaeum sp. B-35]